MTIETTYYADDGTEFDNEAECLEYENKLKHALDGVIFFDENMDLCGDLDTAAREGIIAVIKDVERAKDAFNWIEKEYGYEKACCEFTVGDVLVYDENHDGWYNFTKKLVEKQELYHDILEAVENLKVR